MSKYALIINSDNDAKHLQDVEHSLTNVFEPEGYETFVISPEAPKTTPDHYLPPSAENIRKMVALVNEQASSQNELVVYTTGNNLTDKIEGTYDLDSAFMDLYYGRQTFIMDQPYSSNWGTTHAFVDKPNTTYILSERDRTTDKTMNPIFWAPSEEIVDFDQNGKIDWQDRHASATVSNNSCAMYFRTYYLPDVLMVTSANATSLMTGLVKSHRFSDATSLIQQMAAYKSTLPILYKSEILENMALATIKALDTYYLDGERLNLVLAIAEHVDDAGIMKIFAELEDDSLVRWSFAKAILTQSDAGKRTLSAPVMVEIFCTVEMHSWYNFMTRESATADLFMRLLNMPHDESSITEVLRWQLLHDTDNIYKDLIALKTVNDKLRKKSHDISPKAQADYFAFHDPHEPHITQISVPILQTQPSDEKQRFITALTQAVEITDRSERLQAWDKIRRVYAFEDDPASDMMRPACAFEDDPVMVTILSEKFNDRLNAIENVENRISLLEDIAFILLEVGFNSAARTFYEKLIDTAKLVDDPVSGVNYISMAAQSAAYGNDPGLSAELFNIAISRAEHINISGYFAHAFLCIAVSLERLNDSSLGGSGHTIIRRIREATKTIEEADMRRRINHEIALVMRAHPEYRYR